MQVMLEWSDENGGVPALGLFPGCVSRFPDPPEDGSANRLKVPHMGWNRVRQTQKHALWQGVPDDTWFYFVHSYHAVPSNPAHVMGSTEYGQTFASAIARDNIAAFQFHPEKERRTRRPGAVSKLPPLEPIAVPRPAGHAAHSLVIDLEDGHCVRLKQGDMNDSTTFSEDQRRWHGAGSMPVRGACTSSTSTAPSTASRSTRRAVDAILKPGPDKIPVQLGGGIRDMKTTRRWLDNGVSRVILGTVAVRDPSFLREPARILPAASPSASTRATVWSRSRAGRETSELPTSTSARFEDAGVAAIIYTDIARDGVLTGLNIDATLALAER